MPYPSLTFPDLEKPVALETHSDVTKETDDLPYLRSMRYKAMGLESM
jgi:hypothetical protein